MDKFEVFQDVICYESNHAKDFKTEIRVRKYMRVQAKSIIVHNKQFSTIAYTFQSYKKTKKSKIYR
jgi:hypothetical protein